VFFDRGEEGLGEGFWTSLSRLLVVGSLQSDAGWAERIFGLVLVFFGLVLSLILVAVLLTAFQGLVERAREGNAPVRRKPDLVVLGWSVSSSGRCTVPGKMPGLRNPPGPLENSGCQEHRWRRAIATRSTTP
jgi:hypothetical protein